MPSDFTWCNKDGKCPGLHNTDPRGMSRGDVKRGDEWFKTLLIETKKKPIINLYINIYKHYHFKNEKSKHNIKRFYHITNV